jgi:hypothetical protein
MRLVRAELAAVAEDSAAAGGNESFGSSCWPRRASQDRGGHGPGSGARGLSATGRHGGRPGGPSGGIPPWPAARPGALARAWPVPG